MEFQLISNQQEIQESDILVLGVKKGQVNLPHSACFTQLDHQLNGDLTLFLKQVDSSKFKQIHMIHGLGKTKAKQIFVVGLGEEEHLDLDKLKEVIAKVTQQAIQVKAKRLGYDLDSFQADSCSMQELAHALAEASMLAAYRFHHYKTGESQYEPVELAEIQIYSKDESLTTSLRKGKAYALGTCLARDLVNTPGNLLTPTDLALKAVQLAKRHQLEYTILEKEEMEKLGMGALLAVAQGSEQPPKMIVLKYQGLPEWENVLAFVGKGLTFDTGGISIKPSAKMDEMKMDLGGAAAVLGAMEVIGQLRPACNILAVIPSTENMPSGKALKPGDVITSLSGKTIEVKNTDAEGRLILADGITYAKQLGADYIVDLATLTGAVLIALGDCTTGALTNHEALMNQVLEAAEENGELMWRLPNFEPYKKMVRASEVADLNNAPGRLAGSITAGLFLGEFAEETPWVHLDIAGTAWSERKTDLCPKGGTGVMVRTLATLAEKINRDG